MTPIYDALLTFLVTASVMAIAAILTGCACYGVRGFCALMSGENEKRG